MNAPFLDLRPTHDELRDDLGTACPQQASGR